MKRFILLFTVIAVATIAIIIKKKLEKSEDFTGKELVVVSYSSFISSWGPGPAIAKEFEKTFSVHVRFVDGGDSRLIPQKMKSEGDHFVGDVVIGLDRLNLGEAKSLGFRKLDVSEINWTKALPKSFTEDSRFVPFDWAPLTFIYRKGEITPPRSLEEFVGGQFDRKLSAIDPRTSTPGFVFWEWAVRHMQVSKTDLSKMQTTFFTVSPSWSTAYGLFSKKQTPLVFSYATSAIYHWNNEKDQSYQAVELKEELPVQVEFLAVPSTCRECNLAELFARFILRQSSQSQIMTINYMLPVVEGVTKGTPFESFENLRIEKEIQESKPDEISQLLSLWKSW